LIVITSTIHIRVQPGLPVAAYMKEGGALGRAKPFVGVARKASICLAEIVKQQAGGIDRDTGDVQKNCHVLTWVVLPIGYIVAGINPHCGNVDRNATCRH
jgi:hypothetical protein